jgi:hypothetical protein
MWPESYPKQGPAGPCGPPKKPWLLLSGEWGTVDGSELHFTPWARSLRWQLLQWPREELLGVLDQGSYWKWGKVDGFQEQVQVRAIGFAYRLEEEVCVDREGLRMISRVMALRVMAQEQLEHPLSRVLGTKSILDLRFFFQILEYLHIIAIYW